MRTWLKRMVAGIVSAGTLMGGGLLTAGTANADEIRMPDIGKTITSLTASAATTYPRELVNGGFDYLPAGGWNVISPKLNTSRGKFTSVDPVNGQYIRNAYVTDGNVAWVKWDGFDASKFGWISDQKGGKPQGFVTDHANSVELQRDNDTDNTYAEIVGSEIGKSIYQKIDTQNSTDAVYTVRFDHAALSSEHADGMQALVNGKPVTMTRIGGNKAGDKTGWTGTDIVTHATNTDHYRHDGQWATYEGKVTIPANTPVSTFTFKSLNEAKPDMGNLIDNLTFKIAYRLSYDSNGGTKAKASQISSMTEGKASETDGKVKTVTDDAAGSIPSNENAGAVKQAKSKTNGSVRLAADDDVAEYAANGLPDHLVNGDFEYPSMKSLQHYFTGIDRNRSQWISNGQGDDLAKWSDIPGGLDTTRFGWSSTQTQGAMSEQRANAVELQKATGETTQMGELCASQKDTAIYQDIATTPGTLYRIELDHTSRYRIHLDQMQVMVGAPGHEQPVEMTRTSSNKYGDKIGEKSTTIATHSTNPFGNQSSKDDFSHYVGYYTIPAGQSVTRFTFRQVSGVNTTSGNLLDNIVFTKAYKLDYDRNSDEATGQTPNDTATVKPAKTSTTGGVKNVADTNASLPDHLVNGDFEYPAKSDMPVNDGNFWYISQNDGSYFANGLGKRYKLPEGFDKAKFAWHSTQTGDTDYPDLERADDVQVDYKADGTNHYSEISAAQSGATIYQDVATVPGVMYKWSLKHASLDSSHLDKMSVIIGEPGKETAQEATRTTANGHGDKLGKVGTVISTKVSNPEMPAGNKFQEGAHTGQWETYTGTYIATGTVTRFAFHSIEGYSAWDGNLLDDISFSKAYKLTYDKNASDATGKVPSNQRGKENTVQPAESKTTGNVKTVADNTSNLPDHLVNDSFDYPAGLIAGASTKYPWDDWTVVDPINGRYARHIGVDKDLWAPITGWDASKFAWKSTQTKGTDWQQIAQGVELQKDSKTGNQYAELVAGQAGTALYQDIATIPGVSYRWELKHASLDRTHLDGMSVMIGEPGKESAQDATRTTVNGNGDQPGDVGKVISTKVRNKAELGGSSNHSSRNHDGQWETYTGTYIATGTVTRFTFKSVSSSNNVNGNILDDLSFTKAYRLGYDANGGKGQVPSRTEVGKTETAASKTNGTVRPAADKSAGPESGTIADDRRVLTDTTARQDDGTSQRTITRSDGSVRVETIADTGAVSGCQVYYPAGTRITLATAKADSDCWDSSQIGKTNRTFYGWSANTDANDRDVPVGDTMDRNTLNANVRTEIVMPARAKTVYALWAINPTLSYNVNAPAGSNAPGTPASQTVPYNTAAADKSGWAAGDTGKIPGYRFDGWYTAPNGGNKYDFNTPLTGNVTVYAHWVGNGYTVRFAGNGATGGGTPDQAFQYNIGQNLHRNGFVRDGYTFTGWKRADNQQAYGDGQWVTNLTTQPNGIVTMVAQWSANEAHIRYNPNPPAGKTTGGQGTPNWDGHTGDTPTIGQNGWTIDGYTFAGWATSPDGSGARYAPGARWTANGTLTLYAQWTPGQASLTYDGNGATGGKTDPQTGKTDEKINVRDNGFTRDGYTFVTWNTQADCKGNAVKPNSEWTLRGSSTLYACWAGNVQTLTYHGNGATGGNTAAQSGKTGDELTTNANGFTRDGYTFVRWDTAKDGSGTAYGEGKNGVSQYVMKPAGNDLYAIWKANPATIQYRNDWPNTTGSTPDTTGNTGDTVTISQNSFDRPGYTFTGWSTSKRGDPSLQPGDKHTLEPRTTTVWAQWKADPAHLVYNSNIGTVGSETKTVDGVVDQTVKTITNPFDRPGYTFSGWNTQADGKGKAYATGADYVLTANDKSTPKNTSVLYAQWKINGASLKFNPNGGIGHVDDVTGDAFSTVTIPGDAKEPKITRPGYRFVGWSTEKNPPAGSTFLQPGEGKVTLPAEGSTTVYAQWEPSLTTLPFTGGQAQVPTIWLYAGFALMLIALGVMMPMLRMRMAATKRTGKHMPITGGKHAK